MSDPNNPNIQQRSTPQWAKAQREMFWAPNDGVFQPFNTDPEQVRKLAEERLSKQGWWVFISLSIVAPFLSQCA